MSAQEKFIIYLHAAELSTPSWAIITEALAVRQAAERDDAVGLAAMAMDKEIIVIVPQEEVVLTTVSLPAMSKSQLRAALPYALEDQLIAEVDSLQFAFGPQEDNQIPVAIVAHETMQKWLSLLEGWGIKASRLIPAALILPITKDTWCVRVENKVIVRTSPYEGFACDLNGLSKWLSAAWQHTPHKPTSLIIDQNATTIDLALELPQEKINSDFTDQMIGAARALSEGSYLNLLQGQYAAKKPAFSSFTKGWKVVGGAAFLWVILLLLYPLGSYFLLAREKNKIDSAIEIIYRRHFPKASNVVAPTLRMTEKLQQIKSGASGDKLFGLLTNLGQGMEKTHITLKRLDYQDNQLTIEVRAETAEDLSQLMEMMTQQGLTVKQQNATLAGASINAVLSIE